MSVLPIAVYNRMKNELKQDIKNLDLPFDLFKETSIDEIFELVIKFRSVHCAEKNLNRKRFVWFFVKKKSYIKTQNDVETIMRKADQSLIDKISKRLPNANRFEVAIRVCFSILAELVYQDEEGKEGLLYILINDARKSYIKEFEKYDAEKKAKDTNHFSIEERIYIEKCSFNSWWLKCQQQYKEAIKAIGTSNFIARNPPVKYGENLYIHYLGESYPQQDFKIKDKEQYCMFFNREVDYTDNFGQDCFYINHFAVKRDDEGFIKKHNIDKNYYDKKHITLAT